MAEEHLPSAEEKVENMGFEEDGSKLDLSKYSDVQTTPYGFIYNVGGHSITDMAEEARSNGTYKEGAKYGFSVEKDGDEVIYENFDDAYKAAKGEGEN